MIHAHAPSRRLLWPAILTPALVALLVLALLAPGLAGAKQGRQDHRGDSGAKVHRHHGKNHRPKGHHRHKGEANRHGDHGHDRGKGHVVATMTRNLYLGANLGPAIAAGSLDAFIDANGVILDEVDANDFPTRAEGLAEEILRTEPDLVGLQEVALWRTAPPSLGGPPSATTVRYDYLDLLLDELNEGKGNSRYRVVVVQEEFDFEAPADANGQSNDGIPGTPLADAELNARLTMRDVILARHGAGVQTWNEGGDNFDNLLTIPILGTLVPITRGWTATDAKVRGSHPFRFVNTHLEAFTIPPELEGKVPAVRALQASELVAADGPATSALPVILLGDLNSDDDTVAPFDRQAYEALIAAGMVSRSTGDPFSCCLESSLLAVGAGGDISHFDHQVDHILTRDPEQVTLKSSSVTGLLPVNGFWSSDHAGVFSALRFAR